MTIRVTEMKASANLPCSDNYFLQFFTDVQIWYQKTFKFDLDIFLKYKLLSAKI